LTLAIAEPEIPIPIGWVKEEPIPLELPMDEYLRLPLFEVGLVEMDPVDLTHMLPPASYLLNKPQSHVWSAELNIDPWGQLLAFDPMNKEPPKTNVNNFFIK
jgi:hypothetical protein